MEKNLTPLLVVAAAIVGVDGSVLLHRRPARSDHAGLWEFPGGKVDEGEETRSALVREIAEECGLIISEASLVPLSFAAGRAGEKEREIVLLLYTTSDFAGTPQSLEGGEWDWFSQEETAQLPMPPLDRELLASLGGKERSTSGERGLPS